MEGSVSKHYVVTFLPLTTRRWGDELNPFLKLCRVFPPSPPPRGEGWKQHYYVMFANGPFHINPSCVFYGVKGHVTRLSRVSMNSAHQDNSNDIPHVGWDDWKHHINLTIIQPVKTFRTHNFTYLLCWNVKPILHV
jgi:hypothetical protein